MHGKKIDFFFSRTNGFATHISLILELCEFNFLFGEISVCTLRSREHAAWLSRMRDPAGAEAEVGKARPLPFKCSVSLSYGREIALPS